MTLMVLRVVLKFLQAIRIKYLAFLIALTVIGIIGVKYKKIDFFLSDLFWHKKTGWLLKEGDFWFYFLYKYAKKFFISFLISIGILSFWSYWRSRRQIWKRSILSNIFTKKIIFKVFLSIFVILSYIILVSIIRSNSNIPCPKYSKRYKGLSPVKRPFDSIKCNGCKCFPGAHSTVGFSVIFFTFILTKRKKVVFIFGIALGHIFGFYQVLRGEHYFFDAYFSMLIALWIYYILVSILKVHKISFNKNFNEKYFV